MLEVAEGLLLFVGRGRAEASNWARAEGKGQV